MTRAGFVTLVGLPNAGKSTLFNRLVGQQLALTSPKPQSTRERVVGILSDADTQLVFLDTPGLLDPKDELHMAMRSAGLRAIRDADVIVHVNDARNGVPVPLHEVASGFHVRPTAPVVVAVTKSDLVDAAARDAVAAANPDALLVSSRSGAGVQALLARVRGLVPESPFLYPADDVSSQNLRFFAAELLRETALEQLNDEVPHAMACVIEEFRESRTPVYIRAVLYVERDTQKRIVIGAGGQRIREIGSRARVKIERLTGTQVYLDLWVKVLANWRRDADALRRLGFSETGERSRDA